jgi:hypothetical protein
MNPTQHRCWRRSLRWRKAFKRTHPHNINYWRLVLLGHNHAPFSGHATRMFEYITAMECFDNTGDEEERDKWLNDRRIQDFYDLL